MHCISLTNLCLPVYGLFLGKSRRRRQIKEQIIVEVVAAANVTTYTLVTLIAFKGLSTYIYLQASDICANISSSEVKCVNQSDCNILQNAGINCPVTFTTVAPTTSPPKKVVPILTGGVIAIIAALALFLVIVAVGWVVIKIRRRQVKVCFISEMFY